jgi:hypothetical protein
MPSFIGDIAAAEQHIADLQRQAAEYRRAAQLPRRERTVTRLARRVAGWRHPRRHAALPTPVALWLARPDACSIRCR